MPDPEDTEILEVARKEEISLAGGCFIGRRALKDLVALTVDLQSRSRYLELDFREVIDSIRQRAR